MSPAYSGDITHHCPHVTLLLDRFHLVNALHQAVDEVRTEQWRALDTQGRKATTGLRWLLSRHSRHRTTGHTRFLNSLRHSNRRIHRAWVRKDELEHCWDDRYPASAKSFLRRWMTAALRRRIPTMRTCVGTLRTHLVRILAPFSCGLMGVSQRHHTTGFGAVSIPTKIGTLSPDRRRP